jgi:hypothetical protein
MDTVASVLTTWFIVGCIVSLAIGHIINKLKGF